MARSHGMKSFSAALAALAALVLLALVPQGAGALSIEPLPTTLPAATRDCKVDGERRLDGRRLVGMSIDRGRRIARRADCSFRVIVRRGQTLVVDYDLDHSRLNYAVRDRLVTGFKGAF